MDSQCVATEVGNVGRHILMGYPIEVIGILFGENIRYTWTNLCYIRVCCVCAWISTVCECGKNKNSALRSLFLRGREREAGSET